MTDTTPKSTVVTMVLEKETKNTVRFEEEHEPTEHPVLRNCYISKVEHARLGNPTRITLTIAAALA